MNSKFENPIIDNEEIDALHNEIAEIQDLSIKCTEASSNKTSLTTEDLFTMSYRLQELAQIKMDEADVLEENYR